MAVSLPATALVIDIDTSVTGTSSATVGALTLIQHGSNVDFRFDNLVNNRPGGKGEDAFISELLFSYKGAPSLATASFSNFSGSQSITAAAFSINPPGKDAGYDFYVSLSYPTSSSDRFTSGEFSTWTISNVSVADFLVPVSGSGPASLAMVHVQGEPMLQNISEVKVPTLRSSSKTLFPSLDLLRYFPRDCSVWAPYAGVTPWTGKTRMVARLALAINWAEAPA